MAGIGPGNFGFHNNGQVFVIVQGSTGNVGIATTVPGYTLDVAGNMRVTAGSLLATHNANTVGNVYTTGGNTGFNTVMPLYCVDINGTLGVNGMVNFCNTLESTASSVGALVLRNGGVSIDETTDATSLTRGGSITCAGGVSIGKKLYVGGVTYFKDSTPSTSYSIGAVNIAGGLSISQAQNATNVGNGGALTVQGGASVGQDLYVGGQINGSGSSSSTFAYLTLTATDEAINLTTGCLVTFGGITIQATTNATSVTNGGSLLVNGGGSFAGDIYVGGRSYLFLSSNYQSVSDDIINLYDSLSIKRFSLDLAVSSKSFSISRYNSLGNFTEKLGNQ